MQADETTYYKYMVTAPSQYGKIALFARFPWRTEFNLNTREKKK
jgi:hypothetical protein